MAAPKYVAPTKSIPMGGDNDDLVVRGLSFTDITMLIDQNLPALIVAVEQYRDSRQEVYATTSLEAFLQSMLTKTPELTATIIALACDDPDAAPVVATYPAGVSIKALLAVAELTMQDMGSLQDPSPALGSLVRQVTGALSGLRTTTSPVSPGPSDAL